MNQITDNSRETHSYNMHLQINASPSRQKVYGVKSPYVYPVPSTKPVTTEDHTSFHSMNIVAESQIPFSSMMQTEYPDYR
jgi:hypothetical protein